MSNIVQKYEDIINSIKSKLENKNKKNPKVIAVSKTFKLEKILPLINDSLLNDKSINIIQYRKEQLCIIVEILSKYNNLNSDKPYYLN